GGEGTAKEADGADDGARGLVGGGPKRVLCRRCKRNTEEDHRTEAFGNQECKERDKAIEAAAMLVRKGRDQSFFVGIVCYKKWIDEHCLTTLVSTGPFFPQGGVPWSIVSQLAMLVSADDRIRHEVVMKCRRLC